MEVKIADAMPLWLSEKLAELGIYKISFSKYGCAYQRFVRNQLYDANPLRMMQQVNIQKGTISHV
jgi:hypothetical protein